MSNYRETDHYAGGHIRPPDDGRRNNGNYYNRGRSISPRDRYDDRRPSDRGFSPRHDGQRFYNERNDGLRGRGAHFRSGSRGREEYSRPREYDRSCDYSPKKYPKRYSPSWKRSSMDRSVSPEARVKGRNFFQRSRSRSYSRDRRSVSRSRSRTPPRAGVDRYRKSRSPRNRSPRRTNRRSTSYSSRKRMHRTSSSGSSDSESGSSSSQGDERPKDDFFKSMYGHQEKEESDNGTYLHPVLDRGTKQMSPEQPRPAMQQPTTINVGNVANTACLTALSQAYENSPPQKSYRMSEEIDDEDRFLYGDDGNTVSENKSKPSTEGEPMAVISQPLEVAPVASQNSTSVTPGGFDSNALKNVLKAIGFDFEMSAQQTQKDEKPETGQPTVQPVQQVPQQIQSFHSGQVQAPMSEAQVPQAMTTQQLYQPYNPYSQQDAMQQPLNTAPGINTSLGYPIQVPDPSNPTGNYLIYQAVDVAQSQVHPHALFTTHEASPNLTMIQPQAPVAVPQGGRVVMAPQRSEIPNVEKDRHFRLDRLNYLQQELDKLKRQQSELLRKKRREKDGHKDPMIKKNTMLQAGVEEQIREIQEAAERAAGIRSDCSDASTESDTEDKECKYDYFDSGEHFCKLCKIVSNDLGEFLTHLHSKLHRKSIDPYARPWKELEPKQKKKSKHCSSKALKGSEFLIPITGYFCSICQQFSGDQICAEDHCKTRAHNLKYKKYCKMNPSYEQRHQKKKKKAKVSNGKQDVKEESVEKEVKYVEKLPKKKHKVKKEPEDKHYEEREEREEKPKIKRQNIKQEDFPSQRAMEQERPKKLPKKYSMSPVRSYKDPVSHRKSKWSPGYDEYERRQQEIRYRSPEKRRNTERRSRSRSRDRDSSARWVERDIRAELDEKKRMIEETLQHQQHHENIAAGVKIPTPGFGKFSWNSSSSRLDASNSHFDQIPVDELVSNQGEKGEDRSEKGKIAIKITGKTERYPPKLAPSQAMATRTRGSHIGATKRAPDKRTVMANELQKKVEALKKENALRAQLSSITLPAGRSAKQFQTGPNTAAVILGTRNIGKNKTPAPPPRPVAPPLPPMPAEVKKPPLVLLKERAPAPPLPNEDEEEIITKHIEVDISPTKKEAREPPPPGEEDINLGKDDGAASDASGISMEIASDEE